MAGEQGCAKAEHGAGTLEVECRQYVEFDGYHQADGSGPEYRQRCIDQSPDAMAIIGKIESGDSAGHSGDQIDDGRFLELQIPAQQCLGQNHERSRQKDQRLHPQQVGDDRLAKIVGCNRGEGHL